MKLNRDLKFRAWDTETCMMREVLNLSFDEGGDISEVTVKIGEAYSIGDYLLDTDDDDDNLAGIPCASGLDRFVLMQFTGLQDKSGKDIYEGDIVQLPDTDECANVCCRQVGNRWHSVVRWKFFNASFVINNHGRNTKVEVVGNVYQPPTVPPQAVEGSPEVREGEASQ